MESSEFLLAAIVVLGAAALLPGLVARFAGAVQSVVEPALGPARRRVVTALVVASASAAVRVPPAAGEVPPPIVRLTEPAADSPPDRPAATSVRPGDYLVVSGDSLWAIACRQLVAAGNAAPSNGEVDRYWRQIYAANLAVIGNDPDLIFPGQRLTMPEVN